MGGRSTHHQCIGTLGTPRGAVRPWCHAAPRLRLHATARLEAAFGGITAIAAPFDPQPG
jgi:hypothetical protein